MYQTYSLLLAVAFVAALPYFWWKNRRTGKYGRTFWRRMGRLPEGFNPGRRSSIWVHAVSVGEVLAARELLQALRRSFPEHPLYLSTTTETGHEVARDRASFVDERFYAPFDLRGPVRKVLDAVNPALLVLVETELWPNLIHEAHRRGTRVAVVNGRLSPRSFPRYRRLTWFLRRVLAEVDLFLMQAEPHAERARQLGAPETRVTVSGNLKFDAVARPSGSRVLEQLLPARPLFVAGSTVVGEEEAVIGAYLHARRRHPGLVLAVAPRHPQRFDEVPALVQAAGLRCVRRTALAPGDWRDGDVVLLDTLGELSQLYLLATVVFVGGSLVPAGGHNILEPAAAGRAVVIGPHMENFQEIADNFIAEEAVIQVATVQELGPAVESLLSNDARRTAVGERARGLVERNRGAVARTVEALKELLAEQRE